MVEMRQKVSTTFKKQYEFDETKTTVLDFACGNGSISRELAGDSKSIVGVDISQTLVDSYNKRVSDQGISPDKMRAVCVELKGEEGELDGLKFDVVVCSAAYHHFENVANMTKILTFFLKPGGVLLVLDILDPEDINEGTSGTSGSLFPAEFHHIVSHKKGFKTEDIRKIFEGAGLTCSIDTSIHTELHGQDVVLFVARGQKPAT
ncbi:hexaprenyldihydroxybenzoate methyltransferase [Crepidotus variabilis]|uniref:Hexaprenyldihydroxybenzoate methyltransferase n=1 Tax=Crepidotus variabilis TaxID=179855 RepID=A0A9P6ERK0_9AGAR|nr:hexaprenyldihydroxybenzoate methyltransferase [Crepidotus variabilis]